jgi:hypothetical protein
MWSNFSDGVSFNRESISKEHLTAFSIARVSLKYSRSFLVRAALFEEKGMGVSQQKKPGWGQPGY